MKNYLITLLMIIFMLSLFGCSKKEVNGEIFVVTKGAGNVKLGLVTAYFLTEEQYKIASDTNGVNYLKSIDLFNAIDSAYNMHYYDVYMDFAKDYRRMEKDYNENFSKDIKEHDSRANAFLKKANTKFRTDKRAERYSIEKFIADANNHVINDKSNSDGKFKVELSNQKYWVFANSTRQVSDSSEEYHWLFEYTPDDKLLYLSNDNLK